MTFIAVYLKRHPRNATRANVIRGMDLVYPQTKSCVDSQKSLHSVTDYRLCWWSLQSHPLIANC